MATRRGFLAGLLAAGAVPGLTWADVGGPAYLAAAKAPDQTFVLHGLSAMGESLFQLPLPGRGHAATAHPVRAEAVAFARRPGTFAFVIDCGSGAVLARLTPPEGRQFNGHGAYAADGSVLYTSEVVAEGSAGRIGLWDTRDWTRIGEWDSGGIGPHEIRRMADGGLAVANGGIQTDPSDRTKLNIAKMQPNLTYLDTAGQVAEQVVLTPELRQNSIRHLALHPDGRLAFAMQWEGDAAEAVPLLGLHRRGSSVVLAQVPEAEAFVMQGYAGSIAWNGEGAGLVITSPKAGAAMIFAADGRWSATLRRADLCGAAPGMQGFTLTDGGGAVWAANAKGLIQMASTKAAWDNHLIAL